VSVVEGPQLPEGYVPEPPDEVKKEEEKKEGEWYEAVSEAGYQYYWNTITGGWFIWK